jgi:hypothetical protein
MAFNTGTKQIKLYLDITKASNVLNNVLVRVTIFQIKMQKFIVRVVAESRVTLRV